MKNNFLVIIIFICILATIGIIDYFVTPSVQIKEVSFECGDVISLDIEDYLDLSNLSSAKQQQVIQNASIIEYDFDDLVYPSIGTYYVIICYDNQYIEVDVEIKETESFVFTEFPNSIEVIQGCFSKEEVLSQYQCDDEMVVFDLEDDDVDYQKSGTYLATVVATNELGKMIKRDIEIEVIVPSIELNVVEKSLKVGSSFSLEAVVLGDQDVIYTSSNDSIVSVSSKGEVKALKAGTATISVEANGASEQCSVTVEKTTTTTSGASSSSTSSQSSSNTSTSTSSTSTPYVSSSALELINQERAKLGVSAITYSVTAKNVSFIRLKEIVISFSHTRPNGQYVSSAYKELGYSITASAECIGSGQTSASQIVSRWKDSTSHWEALMNPKYEYGVVSYYQYNGKTYWVAELFAK